MKSQIRRVCVAWERRQHLVRVKRDLGSGQEEKRSVGKRGKCVIEVLSVGMCVMGAKRSCFGLGKPSREETK